MEDSFTIVPRIYLGPTARDARDEGRVTFLPYTNNTWSKGWRDGRPMTRSMDVCLIDASPPDENGFMTFGACVWERRGYVQQAKTIIVEINEDTIRSYGENYSDRLIIVGRAFFSFFCCSIHIIVLCKPFRLHKTMYFI